MKMIVITNTDGTQSSVMVADAHINELIGLIAKHGNIMDSIPSYDATTQPISTEFIDNEYGSFIVTVFDEDHPGLVEFFDIDKFAIEMGMYGSVNPFTGRLARKWNEGKAYAQDMANVY